MEGSGLRVEGLGLRVEQRIERAGAKLYKVQDSGFWGLGSGVHRSKKSNRPKSSVYLIIYMEPIRDGFRESIIRKFTMGRKFPKHPSGSHISRPFVQKHKNNYFKTSLIQILGVDTCCAKLL